MEPNKSLTQPLAESIQEIRSSTVPALTSDVFNGRSDEYLNEYSLFMAHYHAIPNHIYVVNIDCQKANCRFMERYGSEIGGHYYNLRHDPDKQKAKFNDLYYFLYDDLLVYFDVSYSIVRFLFRKTAIDKVEMLISEVKKYKKKKSREKPEISLLVSSQKGLTTKSLDISKPRLKIEDNYNDDFLEVHQTIIRRLSRKNDKGLVLLHGKPGTGKTSYIRYLISAIKKNIVFLPPHMASAITNPDLISILVENTNSVFVIEDAENIIMDRENDGNSPVSALLNISDGLLSDCLNIQIICSFNTDITKVDNALMRKGRLIAKYEFKELEIPKASALSRKLGFRTEINNPMTLTAIYNQEEMEYQQKSKGQAIGFRV